MANQEGQQGQDEGAGQTGSSGRGFAGMDDDSSATSPRRGGRSVPDDKRSFSQDRELASEAGQKGGEASAGRSDGEDGGSRGGQAGSSAGSDQTREDDGRFAGSDEIEQGRLQ